MIEATAHIGIAVYTDESAVKAWMLDPGNYHSGAIFCEIPELGFEKPNLVYCRYGLPLPWVKVEPGDKLWIEPTIANENRWRYTGYADRGESDQNEPFIRGNIFKTEWDKNIDMLTELQSAINGWTPVSEDGGAALKTALSTFLSMAIGASDNILSEKIIGE